MFPGRSKILLPQGLLLLVTVTCLSVLRSGLFYVISSPLSTKAFEPSQTNLCAFSLREVKLQKTCYLHCFRTGNLHELPPIVFSSCREQSFSAPSSQEHKH